MNLFSRVLSDFLEIVHFTYALHITFIYNVICNILLKLNIAALRLLRLEAGDNSWLLRLLRYEDWRMIPEPKPS